MTAQRHSQRGMCGASWRSSTSAWQSFAGKQATGKVPEAACKQPGRHAANRRKELMMHLRGSPLRRLLCCTRRPPCDWSSRSW